MLISYKEFFFIYHLGGIFWSRGGAHDFKGRTKEKFKSHMPYLYLGAEQVCLREGEKLPIR